MIGAMHETRRIWDTWPAILGALLAVGCAERSAPAPGESSAPAAASTSAVPTEAGTAGLRSSARPADLWTRRLGSDWPDLLGPLRNGKSTETGVLTNWPATGPRVVWQQDAGSGYGNCAISRGRAFLFDRHSDLARLTCRHAETGALLWKYEYPTDFVDSYGYDNGPRCTPVVDEQRVYIFGAEGKLHCLDVTDGHMLWMRDTRRDFSVVANLFGVGSTPMVVGELLITMIGGSPPEDREIPRDQLDRVSGNGTGIVAFDKRTGDVRYQLTNELASCSSPVVATIDGKKVCFAWCRGTLVVFDPVDGKIRFRYPWRANMLESVNAACPVVNDHRVFLTEAYGPGSVLLEIRPAGFAVTWRDSAKVRVKAMKAQFSTPIFHNGFLYGCSGRYPRNMELRCIRWETGEVAWKKPLGQRCSLLYADRHLICLTDYGKLQLIEANPLRYELVAEADFGIPEERESVGVKSAPSLLGHPTWAAPVLSHGLLYLRGKSRLICLELIED